MSIRRSGFLIFKGELYYEQRAPSGQGSFLFEEGSIRSLNFH